MEKLLTVKEFCGQTGMSKSQFARHRKSKTGPRVVPIGIRGYRISPAAAEEWIRDREATAIARVPLIPEARETPHRVYVSSLPAPIARLALS